MARRNVKTTKISIAIADDDLSVLRARAKRLHDGNLSASIADARRSSGGRRPLIGCSHGSVPRR